MTKRSSREALSYSPEETFSFGVALGKELSPNDILAFKGDLGAGKTTFIKGIALGYAGVDPREVCSPTFTYLNSYLGKKPLHHFDLYRIANSAHFIQLGFDEFLSDGGVCCIEWSERIADLLPQQTLQVELSYIELQTRKIEIYNSYGTNR